MGAVEGQLLVDAVGAAEQQPQVPLPVPAQGVFPDLDQGDLVEQQADQILQQQRQAGKALQVGR